MIKNSPKDCYNTVLKTTGVIMERINALLQMEVQKEGFSALGDRKLFFILSPRQLY